MTITWQSIRDSIRQRSDNEYTDGEFVTDAELLILANRSLKMLFGKLVESGQHTVTETIYTVPVDGSLNYALPTDCFTVAGVFRKDSDSYLRLDAHDQRVHPRDTVESVAWSYRTHGPLETSLIEFFPRVDSGTYIVRYIGVPADMALTTDTYDGVLGWEEWAILDVAIDLLNKEQLFEAADRLQGRQDRMTQRIDAAASQRDMLENGGVSDVRGNSSDTLFDDEGFLPGGQRGVRGYYGSF
jgi:hypothetical protein